MLCSVKSPKLKNKKLKNKSLPIYVVQWFLSKPQPLSGGIFWISPIFLGFLHLQPSAPGWWAKPESSECQPRRLKPPCWLQWPVGSCHMTRPIRYWEDKIQKSREKTSWGKGTVIYPIIYLGFWIHPNRWLAWGFLNHQQWRNENGGPSCENAQQKPTHRIILSVRQHTAMA